MKLFYLINVIIW